MKTTGSPNPSELKCHICGRPLEVTTIETEDGHYQRYLQCWHCLTSTPGRKIMRIPLHAYRQPETTTQANI